MQTLPVMCKNCGESFEGNYCPQCGQSATTGRFTLKDMTHLAAQAFDFDHGALFVLRQLTTHPALFLRGYLQGRRVRVFGPMRFLLLSAALLAVVYSMLEPGSFARVQLDDGTWQSINVWANSYTSLLIILSIPFYSLATWVLFRNWGYRYAEHLVLNMFVMGFINVLSSVVSVALFWVPVVHEATTPQCTLLYPIVVYIALCRRKHAWNIIKAILASIVGIVTLLLLILGFVLLDMVVLQGKIGLVSL